MVYTFPELINSELTNLCHYLVVGNPISHSLSPVMHQAGFDLYGIQAQYHALKLETYEIGAFAAWMNRDSFMGCNVTIPYKESFPALVDELDDTVLKTGALNTVVKDHFKLIGYNTDVYGFQAPLQSYRDNLEGEKAIIFGTGGAAKAVRAALSKMDMAEIIFISRKPAAVSIAANGYGADIHVADYSQWSAFADDATLIVNTTPLGMYPDLNKSPVESHEADVLEGKICYDLIYNPVETKFLKLAKQAGAIVLNGLEMFMGQGNYSFQLWTGKRLPYEEIRKKLFLELNSRI